MNSLSPLQVRTLQLLAGIGVGPLFELIKVTGRFACNFPKVVQQQLDLHSETSSRVAEILGEARTALAAAKLDELLAAHLRLRTATTAAETAATRTAEETRTAQREKERLDRQQREVDNLEKQAETAKANFNRWRNRDEKQAAQFQASYQSLNARAANERKQLARAKENQARAAADKAAAAQAEEAAEQAQQAAKEAYAKAAAAAAPALKKLQGLAGVPESR